jgi:DeoR family transcriptional regulator of aga operon
MAGRTLDGIAIDTLFLGVDGISTDGTSTVNEGEAAINRMMVERSHQVVVVADGSKIGRRTFARICDCTSVDRLLTDESADPDVIDELEAAGISVEVV